MNWYKHERISEHITRIIDIAGVACYLIEGNEKACLLDTCCGYGNLKEYVSSLTDKELFVILTHGHYDHVGSAVFFEKVYMNPLDMPVLEAHKAGREHFLEEDKKIISALKDITYDMVNPFPENEPIATADGDEFDLGDLTIQMISVPGHSPGMMCALIKEERTMVYGDACGMNVLLRDEFASCVSEYRNALLKLKQFDSEYDTILRNHGSYTNDKRLLDNVLECCDEILAHKDDHHPVAMYSETLYEAKLSNRGVREDGKKGNIIYKEEKRR